MVLRFFCLFCFKSIKQIKNIQNIKSSFADFFVFCYYSWMDNYQSQIIGMAVMAASSLLGAYYLLLKIRKHHSEVCNPDFNHVTHSQLEKLRSEFLRILAEAMHDLRSLRVEIREDTRSNQRQYSKALAELRELIGKNSQDISALIAQTQIANQRITELSIKTDKLALKH